MNLLFGDLQEYLDTAKIKEFIKFLDVNHGRRDPHFCRFIDLSKISSISVKHQDLHPIARQRKTYHRKNMKQKIKMAFLVNNPLSNGMARMYQMLSDDPLFDIDIFESREMVSN